MSTKSIQPYANNYDQLGPNNCWWLQTVATRNVPLSGGSILTELTHSEGTDTMLEASQRMNLETVLREEFRESIVSVGLAEKGEKKIVDDVFTA